MTTYDTIWSQVSVLLAKNENENPVISFVCRECRGAKVLMKTISLFVLLVV